MIEIVSYDPISDFAKFIAPCRANNSSNQTLPTSKEGEESIIKIYQALTSRRLKSKPISPNKSDITTSPWGEVTVILVLY
jgi:hypothetical protein